MRVGVRQLKNSLSHYLRIVSTGEVVYVSDHSRVIAELRPVHPAATTEKAALARLEQLGLITRGAGRLQAFKPIRMRKGKLSDAVLEDRR